MWRWVTLWVLLGAGVLVACGSSTHDPGKPMGQAGSGATASGGGAGKGSAGASTTGGGATADPIPLEDLCPIFTHDLCVYLMECQGARYRDAEHCESELTCFGLPQLTDAAARGAVDYDPSKVGACHARFLESPCTFGVFIFTPDIYEVLQWCPGTVTPKGAAGDSCASDGECGAGLYCNKGADYACPGQCMVPAAEGEPCPGSTDCADGLSCRDDVCAPDAQAGSDCATGNCDYSVSCPKGQICRENIWCDRELGQCQLARVVDEPCGQVGTEPNTSQANCAIHLWCDNVGTGPGVCHEPSAASGPCNDGFYACQDGLHCVGYVPFGADGTLGSCQPPGASGSECSGDDDCEPGLACVLTECRAPGAEGADCNGNSGCAAGLVCVDQKCASARYPGDACDGTRCTYSRCVDGTCEYHLKVGETCVADLDCSTGHCVDGLCYDSSVCNAPEP